jgi:hypothetical protein
MPEKRPYLAVDEVLAPGDSLVSPSGTYVAFLQDDGQLGLCFTTEGSSAPNWDKCYWRSPASPGNQPWGVMQEDGNFVLYNGPQQPDPDHPTKPYFASNTNINRELKTAVLDDGNLVVCTGTPDDPEEIVWSALPQIAAECKFMQNYRVTVPVNGGPEVLAIKNKAGGIELFTLGSTGDIFTFWPDATSETGYSQAALSSGLKATHLAGGADGSGNVVLFASSGNVVYSLAESADPAHRWGTPQPILTPSFPIEALTARKIGGTLYLAALQRINNLDQVAYLRWGTDDKLSSITPGLTAAGPMFLHAAPSTPGGAAEPTLSLVISGGKLYSWSLGSPRSTSAAISDSQDVLGLDVATDGSGADWVVAALKDGQVARLTTSDLLSYTWTTLWPEISYTDYTVKFQDVVTETDEHGGVHVFAVSAGQQIVDGNPTKYNVLYHQPPPAGSQPVPIYKSNGMQLAGVANDAGSIDLFAVGSANLVTHLFLAEDGSNWTEEQVLDPANDSDAITEYSSYATDITLYDSTQAAMASEPVDVFASDRTRVEINGHTFFADQHVPAQVLTDGSGALHITQQTGSLASPLLRLELSADRMPAAAPQIIVEPYADVHAKLGSQKADDLLAAKVTSDEGTESDLLQGEYREGTTPASLAAALESFLGDVPAKGELGTSPTGLAATAQARPAARTARGRATTGRERDRFWSRQELHPDGLRHATALSPGRPIVLTFHENGLSHEHLTAEQAARLSEEKLATLPDVSTSGIRDWFSSIGDAFRAVADGIAKVAQVIYDGLSATFELVIDGIQYAFKAVVQFIEDAFDFVEMVFNYVKVFFETLYRWLALIFDWRSIKQAKIVIANGFDQMLQFLQGAVAALRNIVDSGFETYKEQFADTMDEVIRLLTGYSIGGYAQTNAGYDKDASTATSNNFFFNEFVANGSNTAIPALSFAASDPVSTLVSLLSELTSAEQSSTDTWNDALGYFTNLGTTPDEIFRSALAGMLTVLKGLGLVALDLAQAIVDALLDAVIDTIGAFRQLMNQKISIPFVSTFYKWITRGDELTPLNVVSLAAAIPTAIVYALVTGDRMFTADSGPGSSDDFTSWMQAPLMLQAAGLVAQSPQASSPPLPPTTKAVARGLAGAYLACNFMSGAGGVATDLVPPPASAPKCITYVAIGWSLTAAVFSFPWFYKDTGTLDIEGDVYLGQAFSLVGLAFLYTYFGDIPGPEANDIMAITMTVAGLFLLRDAAYGLANHPDGRVIAWAIVQRVPWAAKFLRTTPVSAATDEGSLVALAWIDMFIGGVTGSVLGFLVLRERYDVDEATHELTA